MVAVEIPDYHTFRRSIAVVIGIDAYANGVPPLGSAANDARRLAQLLAVTHGYEVRLLLDGAATRDRILALLQVELPAEVDSEDRVLFYFAGHGVALEGDEGPDGYLLPVDARLGAPDSYLRMPLVHDALSALPCRHMLVILDSCFSGAFRWGGTRDVPRLPPTIHRERYDRFIADPAWQVISSAAQDQLALDQLAGGVLGSRDTGATHSPFALALFEGLEGSGDVVPSEAGDGVITATELYLYLQTRLEEATIAANRRQTPRLWPLKKHDKGEFIFLAPGRVLDLPPAPALDPANNPWRGLASYDRKDAPLFFGRGDAIAALLSKLDASPFVAVLGASGTGKSSLVKAGVLPTLERDERWHLLPEMRPGSAPLESLARAVAPIAAGGVAADASSIAATIGHWCRTNPQTRLLLVVDQCEELVTMSRSADESATVLRLLEALLAAHPGQFRLMLTLRTDFEGEFDRSPLGARWAAGRYVVPPMTRADFRAIIEEPASARVLYFEPHALVEQLLDDIVANPGGLPLLSFALSEMYVQSVKRPDPDRGLRAVEGGVLGALRARAEAEYDALDGAHRETMERLLLRMVGGDSTSLAKRRVTADELDFPDPAENARIAAVLERLVAARLVVQGKEPGGERYSEPAHDALVRAWSRLIDWIQRAARDAFPLAQRQKLAAVAAEWSRADKALQGGLLWRDAVRSAQLVPLVRSRPAWLNRRELAFAERSVRGRRIARAVTVGATAAIVALGIGSSYFGLQARAAGIRQQQMADSALRQVARTRAGLIASRMQVESDPVTRVLLLSVLQDDSLPEPPGGMEIIAPLHEQLRPAVGRWDETPPGWDRFSDDRQLYTLERDLDIEWDNNLGEGTYNPPKRPSPVNAALLVPGDVRSFIAGYQDGAVQLVLERGRRGVSTFEGLRGAVTALAVSRNGARIVAGGDNGAVAAWWRSDSAASGALPAGATAAAPSGSLTTTPLPVSAREVVGVAVSADGATFAAVAADGSVRLWDSPPATPAGADTPPVERFSSTLPAAGRAIAMSADGRVLAAGDVSGATGIWFLGRERSGTVPDVVLQPPAAGGMRQAVDALALTPDGSGVLVMAGDSLRLWRADGLGDPITLDAPSRRPITAAERRRLAAAASAGIPAPLRPAGSARIVIAPDGREFWFTTGGTEPWYARTLVLPSAAHARFAATNHVQQLSWSPRGDSVRAVLHDDSVKGWRVGAAGAPVAAAPPSAVSLAPPVISAVGDTVRLELPSGPLTLVPGERVRAAQLSPDRRWLATLGDSAVALWSLDGPAPTRRALQGLGEIELAEVERRTLQFSANGATLLAVRASSFQTAIAAWRVADGTLLHRSVGIEERCARLSPDGSRLVRCALRMSNANEFDPADVEVVSWDDSVRAVTLPGSGTSFAQRIDSADFSPDGRHLALLGASGWLQLWPACGTGRPLLFGGEATAQVTGFAFSPDGNRLAIAWSDWDVTVHPITWSTAAPALRAQLVQCLAPNARVTLLGELPGEAQRAWERCERRSGR